MTTAYDTAREQNDPTALTDSSDIAQWVHDMGYTGLSDEQINIYVAYQSAIAIERAEISERASVRAAAMEELKAQTAESLANARATLESVCGTPAQFESVVDDG